MKSKTLAVILIGSVLVAFGGAVHAETSRRSDGGDDAAAKAQYMLRQMASERDALKAQNAKLQEQVDKLQKDVDARKKQAARMKKNLAATGNDLSRSEARSKAIMDRLLQTRAKFQEVIDKFKETIATLKKIEAERNQFKATLEERNRDLEDRTREVESCIRKNMDLYQADLDLVKQYKNKGVWTALLQKEPVTRLKQVDIENRVQEYRIRLDQLKASSPLQQTSQR